LHLVGNRDVGVQVGVSGAAVAVGEGGRDQSLHVDLADTVGDGAAKQGELFDEGERIGDGGPMGLFDLRRDGWFGERPQRRDAFDGGEGEVVAGDRGCLGPGVFGDRGGQFARILRRPASSAAKNSRATSVRMRARSSRGIGQSRGRPAAEFSAAIRLATSTRNGGMSLA